MGHFGFIGVLQWNYYFKQVSDTNDSEVSKLGGTIEWE